MRQFIPGRLLDRLCNGRLGDLVRTSPSNGKTVGQVLCGQPCSLSDQMMVSGPQRVDPQLTRSTTSFLPPLRAQPVSKARTCSALAQTSASTRSSSALPVSLARLDNALHPADQDHRASLAECHCHRMSSPAFGKSTRPTPLMSQIFYLERAYHLLGRKIWILIVEIPVLYVPSLPVIDSPASKDLIVQSRHGRSTHDDPFCSQRSALSRLCPYHDYHRREYLQHTYWYTDQG